MRGEDRNTDKSGPSSASHQHAILMGFRWHPDDSPTLNAGLAACDFSGDPYQYCQETIYFVIFRGRGGSGSRPPPPCGSAHIHLLSMLLSPLIFFSS